MKLVLVAVCLLAGSALAQVLPYRQQYQQYPGYNGYNGYNGLRGYNGYQGYPGNYLQNPEYQRTAYQQQYQTREAGAPILQYSNDVNPDGSFQYSYQTGNGISAQAAGFTRNLGAPAGYRDAEGEAQVVQGSYSYTGPDGQVYTVNYVADENGYRAEGAHLPQPSAAAAVAAPGVAVNALNYNQRAYQPFQQYRPFPQKK